VEVHPGTVLTSATIPDATRVRTGELAGPGIDTVRVSYAECIGICEGEVVVHVVQTPTALRFETSWYTLSRIWSLGDTVALSAVMVDSSGFVVGPADPEYSLEDPADSVLVDMGALANGLFVSRSEGNGRVIARQDSLVGGIGFSIDQKTAYREVRDPVARYLVGVGSQDTARVEVFDARGNRLLTPDLDYTWFHLHLTPQDPDTILGLERVDWERTVFTALDFGEGVAKTRIVGRADRYEYDTVRVIPEPDSVRALPAPENPILSLGRGESQLLGDIYLPGEALTATRLNWTALDPAVATVDGWGFVTALSNGMARFEGGMGASADTVSVTVQAPGG
jgi:hypothetical protein